MALNDKQKRQLSDTLDAAHVSQRKQNGQTLSYIEAWFAISEANRIFGFDGWQRETIEMVEVRPPELVKSSNGNETWRVGYRSKVRVTVGDVVREGSGFGSGASRDMGDAMESAIKEAESDAMKRALMTFGNPFGLALYDKRQANVERKSSAALKRENAWSEFEADLLDCTSLAAVEKCKTIWRDKVKADNWPKAWIDAMPDTFAAHEKTIMDAIEAQEAA